MQKIKKKIVWIFKRHPLLYYTRFKLLSRNYNISDAFDSTYNKFNSKAEIPSCFYEVNTEIFKNGKPNNDLEVVIQLATWLRKHIKGGSGLSEASDIALKKMLAGKGGVCSDMVQIFNNFCVLNDIQVREWGITSIPFDRTYGGHSFNEVYLKSVGRWVLVDVSKCLFFYSAQYSLPLSTIELFNLLDQGIAVHPQVFYETKHASEKSIQKNYLRSQSAPFLVCNYRNKLYDTYLKLFKKYLPIFVIHFLIFLRRKSYHYQFPNHDFKELFSK